MPQFFCCSPSARSFPISPEEILPTTSSPARQISDDSAKNVHIDTTSAARHAYKLQTLLNDTLLPGQLPGSPGGAALGRSIDGDKKTGVPLLEDTLYSSTNARSHFSTFGSQGEALQLRPADAPATPCCHPGCHPAPRLLIPAHLQSSSASFSADYRDGEQVMSPASFSDAPRRPASARGDAAASRDSRPCAAPRDAPSLESLWLLLEPPLLRSVSRRSGQRRLCRQHQLQQTNPDRAEAAAAAAQAAAAATTTAGAGAAVAEAPSFAAAGPLSAAACAALALQQLQRELLTAEELPCCPLLLLPHRVYDEPDVVHVVYDSAGEYTDLHSYLLTQQRLPEASCRSVMRQLLQALSVLHERRWVHRNISTETVWIADAQPAQIPTQIQIQTPLAASGSKFQPWPEQLQPLDRVEALSCEAAPPPPPPPLPPKPPSCTASSAFSVPHSRISTAATATPVVTATAPSYSAATGNPGSSTSSTSGPSRHAAGWFQSGDDDPPAPSTEPAAPLQRPSCCGSSISSSSSACSSSALQPGRKAQAQQRTHQQSQQQQQQSQVHVKLGGLALAVRPVVDPVTGQEALLRELLGSGYHLAPEAISGAGYGRPADVWGAGVLLYMLLTGRPPFPGLNELEVMTRVLLAASASTHRASSSELPPPLPPDLRTADRDEGPAPPPRPSTPATAAATAPAPIPLEQQLPGQPDPILPKPSDPHRRSSGGGGGSGGCSSGGGGGSSGGRSSGGGGGALRGPVGGGGAGVVEAPVGSRQQASDDTAVCMRVSAGGGGGGLRQQQRDPLRELVLQAVLEACASAACREVLAGMLVSEPDCRLTAAELLRLPWFLAGPDEEG